MIDLADIRTRPEEYENACQKKGIKFDVREFLVKDKELREQRTKVETLRASQNALSKSIPQLQGEEKQKKLLESRENGDLLQGETNHLRAMEGVFRDLQLLIPSIPLDAVPLGKDDSENRFNSSWGEVPKFSFAIKDHVELGESLDIIDVERGVKVAGRRGYFLKGDGLRLKHAVMTLAIEMLHKKGYTVMDVPHIVKREAMVGTGYFPGGEDSAYALDSRDEGYNLIGTSEVPVASYYMQETLPLASLPKKLAGYSPCYRREAGASGKDTRGLYRMHQFYKVEQVIICKADKEESMKLHHELLGNAEELMQSLELPYRVVDVCTGDMGQGQVYKHDIEAWMPSRNGYGETHSCSSFFDFQARRLEIKYKDENGKNQFCYTLNNTCVATPRVLIPLLEIHQQADGSVRIPEVLRKYLCGQEAISLYKS